MQKKKETEFLNMFNFKSWNLNNKIDSAKQLIYLSDHLLTLYVFAPTTRAGCDTRSILSGV